jgi:hypothetical protein
VSVSRWSTVGVAGALAAALVLGCGLTSVAAQDPDPAPRTTARAKAIPRASHTNSGAGGAYYVDFRVIDGFIYGHTHIAYGRLDAHGRPVGERYAGFEPKGGVVGAVFGHVAPVSGSIVTSRESVNFALVDSYRRRLNAQQYRSLLAALEAAKKKNYVWNAVLHNCNDFMADMAHAVGLKAPPNMVIPYLYVSTMRNMNEPGAAGAAANRRAAQ